MNFFRSFWDKKFYHECELSLWGGIGRVATVLLSCATVFAVLFYITFGRNLPDMIERTADVFVEEYPNGLVLTLQNGILESNRNEIVNAYPYKISKDMKEKDEAVSTHIVTLDTASLATEERYRETPGTLLFAQDGFVTSEGGRLIITRYDKGAVFMMTEAVAEHFSLFVKRYAPIVPVVIVGVIAVAAPLVTLVGFLLVALVYAVLFRLIAPAVIGTKISFSKSYILMLYLGATALLIKVAASLVPGMSSIFAIPFVTFIIIIGLAFFVYKQSSHKRLAHDR